MEFEEGLDAGDWTTETGWRGAPANGSEAQTGLGDMGILLLDARGIVVDACAYAQKMYRCAHAELIGLPLHAVVPSVESIAALNAHCERVPPGTAHEAEVLELTARRPDGSEFPVALARCILPREPAGFAHLVLQDRTAHRVVDDRRARLAAAVEHSGDALAITDAAGTLLYVNRAFEAVTGYPRTEVIGRPMRLLKSGRHSGEFYANLWNTIVSGRVFRARFINRRRNGDLFYEEKTISPIRDDTGRISHYVSSGRDITEQVHAEQQLRFLSSYDGLTRLPNRNLFMDRLRQAVAYGQRNGTAFALLHVDIDRFQVINDTLGHDAGDELLVQASYRLRTCIRGVDTVARLGGDEFAVLLTDIDAEHGAATVLATIRGAFEPAFHVAGQPVFVTTSIGVACFPRHGTDAVTLLKHANVALHQTKLGGRNGHRFYEPRMTERASENLEMETSLRGALQRGEFEIHYQPQVDLARGDVVGVEALLRWRHPQRGLVSPGRFIPLLEELGIMAPVGEWIVRRACTDVAALTALRSYPLQLAINLSHQQFRDAQLLDFVDQSLRDTGLPPSQLEFEITEGTLMDNVSATMDTLNGLTERGIAIAVDDFGTGYSSLGYLRKFPVDTIKIDRSFVWEAAKDENARTIVRAVISLGRELDMRVVAEGVETEEQLALLDSYQCSLIQGYLFSGALPLAELREFLERPRMLRFSERQAANGEPRRPSHPS